MQLCTCPARVCDIFLDTPQTTQGGCYYIIRSSMYGFLGLQSFLHTATALQQWCTGLPDSTQYAEWHKWGKMRCLERDLYKLQPRLLWKIVQVGLSIFYCDSMWFEGNGSAICTVCSVDGVGWHLGWKCGAGVGGGGLKPPQHLYFVFVFHINYENQMKTTYHYLVKSLQNLIVCYICPSMLNYLCYYHSKLLNHSGQYSWTQWPRWVFHQTINRNGDWDVIYGWKDLPLGVRFNIIVYNKSTHENMKNVFQIITCSFLSVWYGLSGI